MKTQDELISELNTLIEYCKDGEYGYKTAAEDIKTNTWKAFFMAASQQRARFALELESLVYAMGDKPVDHSSVTGALHRTWIDIKSALESGDEKGVLAECKRGDEAAKEKYEAILNEGELPDKLKQTLQIQYQEILKTYEELKVASE